jgi:MFS family permease
LSYKLPAIHGKKFNKNAMLYLYAMVFYSIAAGAFGMLQGIYIKLKIGEDFLGMLISTKTLAMALFAFPCALIVNRIGKKKALLFSMLFILLSITMQGYFQSSWIILTFGLMQGCFEALLSVTGGPFLAENSHSEERVKLFSVSFAVNTFSVMAGYYVFGQVVEDLSKSINIIQAYRYGIIASGFAGIAALVFIALIKETPLLEENKKSITLKDSIAVFGEKGVLEFIIYNSLIGFGAGLVVPYFSVYLKFKINITTSQLGVIMSLSQVATGIGGLITPILANKFGKVNTIIICQIASIPFLLLIATPSSISVVSIAFFMRSALMNMAGPVISNISMELVENEKRSVLSSILNLSSSFTRAISAVAAGFMMKHFANGYEIPYYITTCLYVVATVYFYKTFKSYNSKEAISC